MTDIIVKNSDEIGFPNRGTRYYVENDALKVSMTQGQIHIVDISDALRTGKICTEITISFRCAYGEDTPFISRLIQDFNYDYKKMYEYFNSIEWNKGEYGYDSQTLSDRSFLDDGVFVTIYKSEQQAIRVFSPFNLKYMKPLKEIPKKWNIRNVLRLMVNGQYENLKCNGKYTDDYAYDAAYNYGIGTIENGIVFAKRIIECPSGWWVSDYNGTGNISICCHSFDNNSLTVAIK